MRRHSSDSVLHYVKCRLCRERGGHEHFPIIHEHEQQHEHVNDAATEGNSQKSEAVTSWASQVPANRKEVNGAPTPTVWQRQQSSNNAIVQPSSSNQSKSKLIKSYTNIENLAKILNKLPFARLMEMAANSDAGNQIYLKSQKPKLFPQMANSWRPPKWR